MNNFEKLAKIAVNKSLLKEYSNSSNERVIYMNDGTEFQIQIFNPYSYTVGVSISMNGNEMSNMLVLKPGQRIWLERYLNEARKFLFETYEVSNSKQAKEAIARNGVIEIKFYKEKESNVFIKSFIDYDNNLDVNQPLHTSQYYNLNFSDCLTSCYSNIASDITGHYGYNCGSITASSTNQNDLKVGANSKANLKGPIKTGRIEKGSHSNQSFTEVHNDFETFAFKIETIHIYPASVKPMTTSDIHKKYCHDCGRKLTDKFKYCPFCGAKQ